MRVPDKKCYSIIISFILINSGIAQETNSRDKENGFFSSIRANQDDSYITFSQGIGNVEPLVFEALISPYFLLRTRDESRMGAVISSEIMIRMAAVESLPVRSPSYKPKLTIYSHLQSKDPSLYNYNYLFLTLAHYSNGQDGDFFNEDGTFNTISGDFSTNYFELGLFINKQIIPFTNTTEYFKTSLEYHIDFVRSEELEGRYSFIRWHNDFRIFRFPATGNQLRMEDNPRVQTTIKTTWLFGDISGADFFDVGERLNFSFNVAYRPKVLSDVSLFINIYTGEDYYNMQFGRQISVLRFGLQAYSFK